MSPLSPRLINSSVLIYPDQINKFIKLSISEGNVNLTLDFPDILRSKIVKVTHLRFVATSLVNCLLLRAIIVTTEIHFAGF